MPPKRNARRGGDDDEEDAPVVEDSKKTIHKKGNKRRGEDEDEEEDVKSKAAGKKGADNDADMSLGKGSKGRSATKGKKGAAVEEEEEAPARGGKKGGSRKKRGDSIDDEEDVVAPSRGVKKGGKGDSDDEEQEEQGGPATGALSKTALKKAKRDAKKGKGGDTIPAPAGGRGGQFAGLEDDEEEEEEEEAEEPSKPSKPVGGFAAGTDEEEEEEDTDPEQNELVAQIEHLALETVEEPEEEIHIHKADRKKKKREEEKKAKARAAHGIIDSPTAPTPPPQPVPSETPDIENEPDMEVEKDEEDEERTKKEKKEKKKKKDRDAEENDDDDRKKEKKEKKKKKEKEKEKNKDEDEEEEDEGNDSKKSTTGAGEPKSGADEREDGEPEDITAALATSKKKLSNKERRKLQDEIQKQEDIKTAERMAKPPDNKVFAVSATSVDTGSESWKQSRDVIIPAFSITTTGKTLFNDAELKIAHGRRYGFVGPNGLGKSVLLRAIASRELPVPPEIDCLYVEQEVVAGDEPAVNVVLSADTRRTYLLERERELMRLVDDPSIEQTDEMHDELIAVSDELRISKADAAEAKALNLLRGLGFSDEMCRQPTKHLSGGWRMRVSIAKGLFMEPTLLLLDEPTNHLDLEAVIFLESVLSKWEKTLVVVSHDQDFLDEICQEIIHLDAQKLWYYRGNYTQFEEQFEVQMEQRKKAYEKQLKQANEEKQRKNKLTAREQMNELKKKQREAGGAKSKKGGGVDDDSFAIAAAGKNRGEKNAEAASMMARPKDYIVQFSFPPPSDLSPPIIQVRDVHFRYNQTSPWLFHDLNFGIDMSSRICICGPNGAGKSTLIGLLTGSLEPTEGEIIFNRHLRIAAYKQHFVDALPLNKTPIEYLHGKHNQPEQDIRGRLGRYGLSGVAHTIKMASLSGGQKARVVFADMSYQNPHLIIADEPSNNLDMQSIRALGDAINEFEGGVILVSHDTRLITETNMLLWVVERQTVLEQTGGIEEYREEILEKLERREAEAARILEEKQAKRVAERENKIKELEERKKKREADKAAALKA